MSIKYNEMYVDEKYLPIVEPNLYADEVLIPGVTFTNKYVEGPAGQLFVHKINAGLAVEPGTPGRDFNHEVAQDELIPIALNNNFMKSIKLYGVQANAVAFNAGEEYMSTVAKEIARGHRYAGLACMAKEGTADSDTAAITTGDDAVAKLIALRKQVKDNYGQANFALVSTEVYALFLGKLGFVEAPDPAVVSAEIIRRFGLRIMECNSFDKADAKYIDYTGAVQTVDLSNVEMIVGYSEATSIVPNLEAFGIVDGRPTFNGAVAQGELNEGFRVTSPAQLIVKSKA